VGAGERGVGLMGINFPSSPAAGQVFWQGNTPAWVFGSGRWKRYAGTADTKNRLVNPAMQISQENGLTDVIIAGVHIADNWRSALTTDTGVFRFQRVASPTPAGALHRLRLTVTTPDSNPGGADWMALYQPVEGTRVADLGYGTAAAKRAVVRFGFKGPAGTYAFGIRNTAVDRSFVSPFTVTAGQANTDLRYTISIPPCVDGTWANDTEAWGFLTWDLGEAGGTSNPNTWLSGNWTGYSGMTNGMTKAAGTVFELFDVGFYADPYNTGLAPHFYVPLYEDDLRDCQRYWYRAYGMRGHISTTLKSDRLSSPHPVPMRTTPYGFALVGSGLLIYDGNGTYAPSATYGLLAGTDELFLYCFIYIGTGPMNIGRVGGPLVNAQTAAYLAVNARL